jgi:hypothetical protein
MTNLTDRNGLNFVLEKIQESPKAYTHGSFPMGSVQTITLLSHITYWKTMKSTKRYTLTLEIEEDGRTTRKMIESRYECDEDFKDGEHTIGRLLSLVPAWAASVGVGEGGLGTICKMLHSLPCEFEHMKMFRDIGDAYDKWDGSYSWEDCVSVVVDKSKLCSEE